MKIRFYLAGKKGFSTLEAIINKFGVNLVDIVITAHDRGVENDWCDDIFVLCHKNRLPCYLKDDILEENTPSDYSFAVGWRWMIKNIDNLIVFHDSLLPKYRGFSPLVNMLINGENEIGATALLASDEYDKGGIICQRSTKITYPKKIADAIDDITPIYVDMAIGIVRDIIDNRTIVVTPQIESEATYSSWRDENDYFINWRQDSDAIVRFVNAVGAPYRCAASHLNGEVVRISELDSIQDVVVENRQLSIGKVIFMDKERPVVICGTGLIRISRIHKDGKIIDSIPFRSRFE